jgi:hypothetical protein
LTSPALAIYRDQRHWIPQNIEEMGQAEQEQYQGVVPGTSGGNSAMFQQRGE